MTNRENLSAFYKRIDYTQGISLPADKPHINVFERASCKGAHPYSRRDYYKVTLIIGDGRLEYADKSILINRPALMFTTPLVPYHWENLSEEQNGWFCIFNKAFVHQGDTLLRELPMFQIKGEKIFYLSEDVTQTLSGIYRQMMAENEGNYPYKQSLLRDYLHIIIHQALKLQPVLQYEQPLNAASRITTLFLELLDRQFPIDSLQYRLQLTSAQDFARQLSVHTNHLNRVVKEITGKTTTEHISARIISEAQELLTHSDWPVAEIAYCLGFEYPAYFNNFYKRITGKTPMETRKAIV